LLAVGVLLVLLSLNHSSRHGFDCGADWRWPKKEKSYEAARVLVGVVALAVVAGIAGAQESYPTRPITLVAPFPPGGVADLTGARRWRVAGEDPQDACRCRQQTGAAGAVGMPVRATSRPDGYTLLLALSSALDHSRGRQDLGRPPASPSSSSPDCPVSADPTVWCSRREPWKTAGNHRGRPEEARADLLQPSGVYGTLHMAWRSSSTRPT